MKMNVSCEGCGRCCISPFNEVMVSKLKDSETRRLLMSIGPPLVEDGVIIPQKVARSGEILFRDEVEEMIDEGLVEALAPNNVMYHQETNTKAIIFRLRHMMMPFTLNEVTVPVFGCIFFNHETKRCEIFTKDFRPRQCSVFPFNRIHTAQKLKQEGKIKGTLTIMPVCSERLEGVLTTEQTKQIEEYVDLLKPPKIAPKKNSALSWKKLITELTFPAAVQVSDHVLQVLGIPTTQERASEGWDIADWRKDLAGITKKILSNAYGKDRVNPRLNHDQKHFAKYIRGKLINSYKWWLDFKLTNRNINKIYETMVEIFYGRFLANLNLQYAKQRDIALYNYLLGLRS